KGVIGTARAGAGTAAVMAALFEDAREVVTAIFAEVHVEIAVIVFLFSQDDGVALMKQIGLAHSRVDVGRAEHPIGKVAPVAHLDAGFVAEEIVEAIDEETAA